MNSASKKSPAPAWPVRLATVSDIPALDELIPRSVRALQTPYYTPAQMEAAIGTSFGVDEQLIADRTYFVVEHEGRIIGCGGWSKRRSFSGPGPVKDSDDPPLDPATDAARVRAFFVHPDWARRGVARAIMTACEQAIIAAGFKRIELVATLAGEPLYASFGCIPVERYDSPLPGGLGLPVVRMIKKISPARG